MNWDPIKFHDALARETSRLRENELLSDIERETFVIALNELSNAILLAEPHPLSHGEHVDAESIQVLRDAIRVLQNKRIERAEVTGRIYAYQPFDLLTQVEADRSGSINVVVADFRK